MRAVFNTPGLLLVPVGTSYSSAFKTAKTHAYLCMFQPKQYLGLDVCQPNTVTTKPSTVLASGAPLVAFRVPYGFVVFRITVGSPVSLRRAPNRQ